MVRVFSPLRVSLEPRLAHRPGSGWRTVQPSRDFTCRQLLADDSDVDPNVRLPKSRAQRQPLLAPGPKHHHKIVGLIDHFEVDDSGPPAPNACRPARPSALPPGQPRSREPPEIALEVPREGRQTSARARRRAVSTSGVSSIEIQITRRTTVTVRNGCAIESGTSSGFQRRGRRGAGCSSTVYHHGARRTNDPHPINSWPVQAVQIAPVGPSEVIQTGSARPPPLPAVRASSYPW